MPGFRAMLLLLAALLAAAGACGRVEAQPATPTELKAAYLINFLRYTRWPTPPQPPSAQATAPLRVVLLGSGRLASVVRALLDQHGTVGPGIELVHLAPGAGRAAARQALRNADAMFVEADAWPQATTWLTEVDGRPVLTVGDAPGFARDGGMLGLVQQGSRIVFDANPTAIRVSGLQVSSKVLKLARIVGPESPS
jgi:hypothetical protein